MMTPFQFYDVKLYAMYSDAMIQCNEIEVNLDQYIICMS